MQTSLAKSILFILIGTFFASWVFWLPQVSSDDPLFVWAVSIFATAAGLLIILSLVLEITLAIEPVQTTDEAIVFERVRLFPPGRHQVCIHYAWMHRFTLVEQASQRTTGAKDLWFEVVLNRHAPKALLKKRTHHFHVNGNWQGSPRAIERLVNQHLAD